MDYSMGIASKHLRPLMLQTEVNFQNIADHMLANKHFLDFSVFHTCWEGPVVKRRLFIFRPVKVCAGGHTQHQCQHMAQPQDALL